MKADEVAHRAECALRLHSFVMCAHLTHFIGSGESDLIIDRVTFLFACLPAYDCRPACSSLRPSVCPSSWSVSLSLSLSLSLYLYINTYIFRGSLCFCIISYALLYHSMLLYLSLCLSLSLSVSLSLSLSIRFCFCQ